MNHPNEPHPALIGFDLPIVRAGAQPFGAISLVRAEQDWLSNNQSNFLSHSDQKHFQSIDNKLRRQSLLLGRYAAKRALRFLLPHRSSQTIAIITGEKGEPLVRGDDMPALTLSLAHSDSVALAAVLPAPFALGVDIERLRPDLVETLSSHIKARELALMPKELHWSPDQHLLALWCIKEAVAKALQTGFTLPFEQFEIAALSYENGWLIARFAHLPDYQAQCVFAGMHCLAMVFGNGMNLMIDREGLYRALKVMSDD